MVGCMRGRVLVPDVSSWHELRVFLMLRLSILFTFDKALTEHHNTWYDQSQTRVSPDLRDCSDTELVLNHHEFVYAAADARVCWR